MTGERNLNSAKYKILVGNCFRWVVYKKVFFIWWPVYYDNVYSSAVQYIENNTTNIKYFDKEGKEL